MDSNASIALQSNGESVWSWVLLDHPRSINEVLDGEREEGGRDMLYSSSNLRSSSGRHNNQPLLCVFRILVLHQKMMNRFLSPRLDDGVPEPLPLELSLRSPAELGVLLFGGVCVPLTGNLIEPPL